MSLFQQQQQQQLLHQGNQQQQQQAYYNNEFPKIIDVNTDSDTNQTYVKAFLINDSVNENSWQIPQNILAKYATSFIGKPLILHPSGDHPNFTAEGIKEGSATFIQDILRHQEQYKIGDIIDVKYEPVNHSKPSGDKAYYAYIKLSAPQFTDSIKKGSSSLFVSPLIFDLDKKPPGQPTTNFFPIHLAVVNEPAYGSIAKIKAACSGNDAGECISALKKAALDLVKQIDDNSGSSSYFVKNTPNYPLYNNMPSTSNTYNNNQMDPNYPGLTNLAQVLENVDPNQQLFTYNNSTGSYQPVTTSKTTKTRKVDQQGNILTETQDYRPGKQLGQQQNQQVGQQQLPQSQQQGQNQQLLSQDQGQGQQPQTTIDQQNSQPSSLPQQQPSSGQQQVGQLSPTYQLPNDILEKIKQIDLIQSEFDDLKKFKQLQEEKQLLEASEQQRQVIDQAFMPLFPDDGERQQVTDFFVALNVNDDQLQKLLDFVTKGTLNTDSANPQGQGKGKIPPKTNQQQQPSQFQKGAGSEEDNNIIPVVAHTRRKGGFKGASLVMSPTNNPNYLYDEHGNATSSSSSGGKFSRGILGDINWKNLL